MCVIIVEKYKEDIDMEILVDVHTHTIASGHAYCTLDENMKAAAEKKMKVVAMTDHTSGMPGGAHDYHFSNLKAIPSVLHGVTLLKGAEVNIIDYEGTVDLENEVLKGLDLAIASLHPPCIDFADEQTITTCIEKVMENKYISMIGHPGDNRYPMDFKRMVEKAKETSTLLEVNNASLKPGSFRQGVRENLIIMLEHCKAFQMPVVIGSDAHFYTQIGDFTESIQLLEDLNFPQELVLNGQPEKLLEFLKKKRLK